MKYLLFFSIIKGKVIKTTSKIKLSNIRVELDIGNFIEYWIFMEGHYEENWQKQIQNYIKGKVFIDIGANIGIYSLSLFKDAKYIYAIEPETLNYRKLVRNIKINSIDNIHVIKCAVSSENKKKVKLYLNQIDSGQHSLLISHSKKYKLVRTITLDYFIRKSHISNIGLIKIDVEGAELNVLKGAIQTINRYQPKILIEFNRKIATSSGYDLFDLYKFMMERKYKAYRLLGSSLVKLERSKVNNINYENILFI